MFIPNVVYVSLGSLSSNVFERRTSTGSEVFSLLTCLDDIKFVFLSFFTVIEAIWLKIWAKPPSKNEKRPLPVDVRHSKTLLLKLPIMASYNLNWIGQPFIESDVMNWSSFAYIHTYIYIYINNSNLQRSPLANSFERKRNQQITMNY